MSRAEQHCACAMCVSSGCDVRYVHVCDVRCLSVRCRVRGGVHAPAEQGGAGCGDLLLPHAVPHQDNLHAPRGPPSRQGQGARARWRQGCYPILLLHSAPFLLFLFAIPTTTAASRSRPFLVFFYIPSLLSKWPYMVSSVMHLHILQTVLRKDMHENERRERRASFILVHVLS